MTEMTNQNRSLQRVLDVLDAGMFVLDSGSRIMEANRAALGLTNSPGSSKDKLIGRSIREVLDQRLEAALNFGEWEKVLFGATTHHQQEIAWVKNGQTSYLTVHVHSCELNDNTIGLVVHFEDRSEYRLLKDQIAQLQSMASLRDAWINAGSDINTVLSRMVSNCEHVSNMPGNEETVREHLATIASQVREIRQILGEVSASIHGGAKEGMTGTGGKSAPAQATLSKSQTVSGSGKDLAQTVSQASGVPPYKRLLIVDDESDMREVLAELLTDLGYEVCVAADGRVALNYFEQVQPDAIIADMQMPHVNGRVLYETIKKKHPKFLPHMMFITGDTMSEEARNFLAENDIICLSKPFRIEELRESLEALGARVTRTESGK